MPNRCGLVERAFQLAESGGFERLRHIAAHLKSEGYYDADEHFTCPLLRRQLRERLDRSGARRPRKQATAA